MSLYRRAFWLVGVTAALLSTLPQSHCAIIAYTDRTAFDAALGGLGYTPSTLNFDSETAGSLIASGSSVGDTTFTYNFGGPQLLISDVYATTSGANFLGTDDGNAALQDGDDFAMSFAARSAVGMYLISADPLFDGDIQLTTGTSTASLVAANIQQTLFDGSNVFFLGLIDNSSTFTSAALSTHGPGGAFLYNVDDIVLASAAVPEPSSVVALASGAVGIALGRRYRRVMKSKE
jgi:hypothetical protein